VVQLRTTSSLNSPRFGSRYLEGQITQIAEKSLVMPLEFMHLAKL
jgi:hypothetical protein